jgi:hypothetical protein
MEHNIYLKSARYKDKNGMSHFHNHYTAEYNGKIIVTSDVAEHAAARYLMNNDLAKEDDMLVTYVEGKRSLTGSIKWFAEHTVQENEKISARTVKWRPFDKSKFSSSNEGE